MPAAIWCEVGDHAEFSQDVKRLKKKFRQVEKDVAAIRAHLEQHACEQAPPAHVQVPGSSFSLWKLRWPNSSKQSGKSGGFRFLYAAREGRICPVRLYDKSEREDVPLNDVAGTLKRLEKVEAAIAATVASKES